MYQDYYLKEYVAEVNRLAQSNQKIGKNYFKLIINYIAKNNLKFETLLENLKTLRYDEFGLLIDTAKKLEKETLASILENVRSVVINTRALSFKNKVDNNHFRGFANTISLAERRAYNDYLNDAKCKNIISDSIENYPNKDISKYESLMYHFIDNYYHSLEIKETIKNLSETEINNLVATIKFHEKFADNPKPFRDLGKKIEKATVNFDDYFTYKETWNKALRRINQNYYRD